MVERKLLETKTMHSRKYTICMLNVQTTITRAHSTASYLTPQGLLLLAQQQQQQTRLEEGYQDWKKDTKSRTIAKLLSIGREHNYNRNIL